MKKKCRHVGGFIPEYGPKPKNWKPKSKKGNIDYWLCMNCGSKRKFRKEKENEKK